MKRLSSILFAAIFTLSCVLTQAQAYFAAQPEAAGGGKISNKKMGWYFVRRNNGKPPAAQQDFDFREFGAYYLGDTEQKALYLTFDEGYENGYTEKILDILKEKNVPAAFFVTQTYIRDNIEIVKRMADEGHLVCNHSVRHKSFPTLSDEEIVTELNECADYYKEVINAEMPKFFRPPMGEYSARVLDVVNKQGYKTIFWSFAYKDWEINNQPSPEETFQKFMKDLHNGEITLLHAVSKANTEALGRVIDKARESGFEFYSLNDLPA
jgi:peptidoglycan-N-acetylmuramic acid deacetylase